MFEWNLGFAIDTKYGVEYCDSWLMQGILRTIQDYRVWLLPRSSIKTRNKAPLEDWGTKLKTIHYLNENIFLFSAFKTQIFIIFLDHN